MTKKKMLLTIVAILSLSVCGLFAYTHLYPEETYQFLTELIQGLAGHPAEKVQAGNTYLINDRNFKFVDDKHFFYLIDNSDYQSEKELEDYRKEMENEDIYPHILLVEGEYQRKGDDVFLKETRGLLMTFDSVAAATKKTYASLKPLVYVDTGYNSQPQLVKIDKAYQFQLHVFLAKEDGTFEKTANLASYPVYEATENLPDGIDQFLKDYQEQLNK